MNPGDIVDIVFTSAVTGLLGALLWTRLNRLELGLDQVRHELADVRERMATKEDLGQVRSEAKQDSRQVRAETKEGFTQFRAEIRGDFAQFRDEIKQDFAQVRQEMSAMREEMAVMRSDLTHVALAVGANRPKPMER